MNTTKKELLKTDYELDLEIERLVKEFSSLSEENTNLIKEQEDLKNQEKRIKLDRQSIASPDKQFADENLKDKVGKMINSIEESSDPHTLAKIKYKENELVYNSKIEYLKKIKGQQESVLQVAREMQLATQSISEVSESKLRLIQNLDELNNEFDNIEIGETNLNLNALLELMCEKKELLKDQENLYRFIGEIQYRSESVITELKSLQGQISNQKELIFKESIIGRELMQKANQIKFASFELEQKIQGDEKLLKKTVKRIENHGKRLANLENLMKFTHFYVKYSSSFVNSMYNLVNTRRIYKEMLGLQQEPSDSNLKKLNQLEKKLIDDYEEVECRFKDVFNELIVK